MVGAYILWELIYGGNLYMVGAYMVEAYMVGTYMVGAYNIMVGNVKLVITSTLKELVTLTTIIL